MQVKYLYNIDQELLDDLAEEREYWADAQNFWYEVKEKKPGELTTNQREWLKSIERQLDRLG